VCFTPTIAIIAIIGIVIALFFIVKSNEPIVSNRSEKDPIQIINQLPAMADGGDSRYSRAPEPLRLWQTPPDIRGAMLPPGAVPINISTRGLPQAFQQMGFIKTGEQILPLYGRQTAYRSDRYNYYTRTDSYNPIQLPIRYEKRDCMDSVGCNELLGGERVSVGGIGKEGNVEVYHFDGPTYIPGIV
jgi:hypothetical protein